jgi:hypothetical protein
VNPPRSRYFCLGKVIRAIGLVAWSVLTVALIILTLKQPVRFGAAPKTRILDCGNSTAEARGLGCQFDVLGGLWIPAECADNDLNRQFMERGVWFAYSDKNATHVLSVDEMSERVTPQVYWTSRREHFVHCAYNWRRQHQGYLGGGYKMDRNAVDYRHTIHCTDTLMKYAGMGPEEMDAIVVGTSIGFSTCILEV